MKVIAAIILLMLPAYAHQAPSGWQYPPECCSERDCEPLPPGSVQRIPSGWLLPNGEVFPFEADTEKEQTRDSPDFQWHWCRLVVGFENGVKQYGKLTIKPTHTDKRPCVFVPDAGG